MNKNIHVEYSEVRVAGTFFEHIYLTGFISDFDGDHDEIGAVPIIDVPKISQVNLVKIFEMSF